ncbi:uncharacterized protein LOC119718841 [Patiria miniata]|uniref:Uncharacterized protein n=1 Tax=Patiria miniata TaxID=46514 RepID=A0A913YWM0_PATMI|nr:uncharacterized protein LOC119718841 [Patiria miniata]
MKTHFSVLLVILTWTLCVEVLNTSATETPTVTADITDTTTENSTIFLNITTPESSTDGNSTLNGTSVPAFVSTKGSPSSNDEWIQGLKTFIFIGFWVVVALVIFILIPTISISLDRMCCRRTYVKTYTVNRRDRIGVELQEATSATLYGSDREDGTTLMLPEPVAAICSPVPTTPPVVEHQNESRYGEHSQQTAESDRSFETTKMQPATESLDSVICQLTNISEDDFAWPSPVKDPTSESLRDRSQSAGVAPGPQLPKNLPRLYSDPQKGRKGPEASLSNEGPTSQPELLGVPRSGSEGGQTPGSFHLVIAKGDKDGATATGAPTSPEEWRNESYLHSPTAASNIAAIPKWESTTTGKDKAPKTPSNPHLSRIHVYEELTDTPSRARSPDNRLSVSESNLLQSPGCKITLPQYFEVNDFTGIPSHPKEAQQAPLGPGRGTPDTIPDSLTQLTQDDSSSDEEDRKHRTKEGYQSAIKVRTRKGLMAGSLSTKHRLSDGALEKRPPIVPQQHFGSLQRCNVPVAGPKARKKNGEAYSKLNRFRPPNKAKLHTSGNVYNKLSPPVDPVENRAETLGGDTSVYETSL